jgi:hypothetical protein
LLRALLVEELIRLEDHTIQRHTTVARRLLYRLRVLLFLQLLLVPLQIFVALQLVKIPALAVYPDLKQKNEHHKKLPHRGNATPVCALKQTSKCKQQQNTECNEGNGAPRGPQRSTHASVPAEVVRTALTTVHHT